MRVLNGGERLARCVDRHGVESDVDVSLVGPVVRDAWILASQGSARALVEPVYAARVDRALAALEAALAGDPSGIDGAFADLIGREPRLADGSS